MNKQSFKNDFLLGRIEPPRNKGLLFDDFINGVNPDKWVISTQKWGGLAIDNHPLFMGCVSENVSFTKEGILLLKCTGNFSASRARHGELSGAVIINKTPTGPGRYELAMKALPRLGACNGFWTFYSENNGEINHEIDYEIPGHPVPNSRPLTTGYDRTLASTWIHEADPKTSGGIITPSSANDGRWHLYRFDWHTTPVPKVEFYIDNTLVFTSFTHIPFIQGYLHIGAWMPRNWCGSPNFEEDYMLIDWFNYTPFENQPFTPIPKTYPPSISYLLDSTKYPTTPVPYPDRDFISNKYFDGVESAWIINGNGQIKTKNATSTKKCLELKNNGFATQKIEQVFQDYEFYFEGKAKSKIGYGKFEFAFYTQSDQLIEKISDFEFNSKQYSIVSGKIRAPINSNYLIVKIVSADSSTVTVDSLSLKMILPYKSKSNPAPKVKTQSNTKNIIQISTQEQLFNINQNLSASYELVNDIVLTKSFCGIGKSKTSVFDNEKCFFEQGNGFSGQFNGNGFSIKNFNYLDLSVEDKESYHGFFNQTEPSAIIENLRLEGGDNGVQSKQWCAAFIGLNKGTIRNCHASVKATSLNDKPCGSLVAKNEGLILNCYTDAIAGNKEKSVVHGSGLTGFNYGTINFSYTLDCTTDADMGLNKSIYEVAYRTQKNELWFKTKDNLLNSNWDETVWALKDGEFPSLRKILKK